MNEAVDNYRQALKLKPVYPDAHKNLGLALLAMGEYAEGWKEYESRWQSREMPARKLSQPRWDGSPLEGKTILLYAEQGLGDTLQFIRYASLVAERGGKVMVECQKAPVRLLGRCPGIFRLIAAGDNLSEFQVQAPLLSLPGIFGTNQDSIPATVPYLSAEPDRIRQWGEELKGITGFKIGIAWQGSAGYQDDKFRLVNIEPLARLEGVRLVSLQKGHGSEQLAEVSKAAEWRWLLQREDRPWYPSMKLFRQKKGGDRKEVFQRMAQELESLPLLESAAKYAKRRKSAALQIKQSWGVM